MYYQIYRERQEGAREGKGNCSLEKLQHHFKALLLLHLTRGNNNWWIDVRSQEWKAQSCLTAAHTQDSSLRQRDILGFAITLILNYQEKKEGAYQSKRNHTARHPFKLRQKNVWMQETHHELYVMQCLCKGRETDVAWAMIPTQNKEKYCIFCFKRVAPRVGKMVWTLKSNSPTQEGTIKINFP